MEEEKLRIARLFLTEMNRGRIYYTPTYICCYKRGIFTPKI